MGIAIDTKKNSLLLTQIFNGMFYIAISCFVFLPQLSSIFLIACLLLALYHIFNKKNIFDTYDGFVIFALLAYPILSLVSLSLHGQIDARSFDTPSRFILVIPLYLYFIKHPVSSDNFMIPCAISGLFIGGLALYEFNMIGIERSNGGLNAITFGQLAVLQMFFSAVLLFRQHSTRKMIFLRTCLAGLGILGALIAAVLSGSRGPLLALPFLSFLLLYLMPYYRKLVAYFFILFGLIIFITYVFFGQDILRLNDALADLVAMGMGNTNNSIGIRTQVWQAAVQLFKENPLFGIGYGEFSNVVTLRQKELAISQSAVGYHAHNDYLQLLAEMGVLGLISILFLFVGSVFLVFKRTTELLPRISVLAITVCWLIFGLTQVQLAHQRVVAFELIALVFCLALAKNTKKSTSL